MRDLFELTFTGYAPARFRSSVVSAARLIGSAVTAPAVIHVAVTTPMVDGRYGVLAQAAPTAVYRNSLTTARGFLQFDREDILGSDDREFQIDLAAHELLHVLGFGTLPTWAGMITNGGFNGPNAVKEWQTLTGRTDRPPVESAGGVGTVGAHWSEAVFGNELGTGYIGGAGNPLSRLTLAAIRDLGYAVDMDCADPYEIPQSTFELHERIQAAAFGVIHRCPQRHDMHADLDIA